MANAIDILGSQESAPLLEQLAGEGRGRVFELSIDEIRLGREEENDIVINDESVSRLHAKIEKSPNGEFVISDNKSKNGVIVNKEKVTNCVLSHGDIIQLGHFVFRFKVPEMSSPKISASKSVSEMIPKMAEINPAGPKNNKRLFIYLGLIIFVGVAYLMNTNDTPKTEEKASSEKAEETFKPTAAPEFNEKVKGGATEALEDPITRTEKEIISRENKEGHIKESELYFRKGQRDYFNKNYHHAIDNFDSAISLWSQHPLAAYYRGLAAHDSEVEAEKNREIGLKYFNSLQYSRAIYHFKSAIDNLSHTKTDNVAAKRIIQECERYIDLASRKLKAAELVP